MAKILFHNFSFFSQNLLENFIKKSRDRLKLFTNMSYIREMELQSHKLYNEDRIYGFCHLGIGQEHLYAALKPIIKENDKVMSSYRCHGLAYITGSSIKQIIGEMIGSKKFGLCAGKGGSMHLYNNQFFGGHGIVGSQAGLSTGIAFSQKYLKENAVTFCFLGDGAMNQGQVYESINLAFIYNLPIIFIIENNGFGMWTEKIDKDLLFKRVSFSSFRVEEYKCEEIIGIFEFCRNFLMEEKGPILFEILTERLCGHSCRDNIKREGVKDRFEEFKDLMSVYDEIKINVKNEVDTLLLKEN